MGTRNLTVVIVDGEHKLAQYGQWDGYPSGQGLTALEFCREFLDTPDSREAFKNKLKLVRFVKDDEHEAMWQSVGATGPLVNMEQVEVFNERWPYFSRDHGAAILGLVNEAEDEVLTQDSFSFAADSLFCEWAYVIDFDQGLLEVYEGFNKVPVPEGQRFAEMAGSTEGYFPIVLKKTYRLDNLPSDEQFLAETDPPEPEEEPAVEADCSESEEKPVTESGSSCPRCAKLQALATTTVAYIKLLSSRPRWAVGEDLYEAENKVKAAVEALGCDVRTWLEETEPE